jgi:alanyl-tRNA synthetase
MLAQELRQTYQDFFEKRGHARIPSAALLPENDPTVLFTTAGMHPLVPFLLGEAHPRGRRLVNVQRCIRTGDIEEVGDASHLTFFEMMGNWSLGDYFKQESLTWSFEFLRKELDIPLRRLAVTVFAGDKDAPRDDLSADIWQELGIPSERIFYLPKADNWWGPAGQSGPCGADSEIFVDTGRPEHPGCQPGCACGRWLEIWNNVFMEYNQTADGQFQRLRQQNVDTGMGVERTVTILQGKDDVYRIETLYPIIQRLEELSGRRYADAPKPFRIITDHLRAAALAIADGAAPSNIEAGYVVRRLIRRAVRYGRELGIQENFGARLVEPVLSLFTEVYPGIARDVERVMAEMDGEETKFKRTLERGLGEVGKVVQSTLQRGESIIRGADAFNLFETYGFPLPFTMELAQESGLSVDEAGFEQKYQEHRQLSQRSHEQKFKGGLADHAEQTTRLHTATHLLHQALRQVLGVTVRQMGSNITVERLRFDFAHAERMTPEQLQAVEALVNEQIQVDQKVTVETMALEEALQRGALAFFSDKYGGQVKVYTIGGFSKEVCGGPHATHTGELGHFRIVREEAVGAGVRRIRAVLE